MKYFCTLYPLFTNFLYFIYVYLSIQNGIYVQRHRYFKVKRDCSYCNQHFATLRVEVLTYTSMLTSSVFREQLVQSFPTRYLLLIYLQLQPKILIKCVKNPGQSGKVRNYGVISNGSGIFLSRLHATWGRRIRGKGRLSLFLSSDKML